MHFLRFISRFKNSRIRNPQQLAFSNIDNIHISDNVVIDDHFVLRIIENASLFIGAGTRIGYSCHISGTQNSIIIGREVLIAPRVYITTTNYRYDDVTKSIMKQGYSSKGDVIIGDESWLGIGSCILSGAKIGKHSVIGANSVVTNDIPPYSVAVGCPAHVIKQYDFKKKKWLARY